MWIFRWASTACPPSTLSPLGYRIKTHFWIYKTQKDSDAYRNPKGRLSKPKGMPIKTSLERISNVLCDMKGTPLKTQRDAYQNPNGRLSKPKGTPIKTQRDTYQNHPWMDFERTLWHERDAYHNQPRMDFQVQKGRSAQVFWDLSLSKTCHFETRPLFFFWICLRTELS